MHSFRPLRPGGGIGIFAPGSPANPARVRQGVEYLESLGYRVVLADDPGRNYGRSDGSFSSGTVAERVNALGRLLEDDTIDVILAARGAYGSLELLPALDFARIQAARKAIIGYSDVTTLVTTIPAQAHLCAVHGPTLTKEGAEARDSADARWSVESLLALLSDENYRFSTPVEILKAGEGEGEIVVGNLTVLSTLLGSPWDLSLDGKILIVEETGEAPYRIHRMLLQLLLAGKLDALAALCFGRFSKCEARFPPTVEQVWRRFIEEWLPDLSFPVVAGLPCGHEGKNVALACGAKARVRGNVFEMLESPLTV